MSMERKTSYGMLREACSRSKAAEKLLGYLESSLSISPFSFEFFDVGDADSRTCYMAGLCDGLVAILDDDVFNDKITIMSTLMATFWDET